MIEEVKYKRPNGEGPAIQLVCDCSQTELRIFTDRGGNVHYKHQCLECGNSVGSSISRDAAAQVLPLRSIRPFDGTLEPKLKRREEEATRRLSAGWVYEQEEWWARYREYLKSPEWKAKRALVMVRAKGQCEGCLERPATQVHHFHYRHVFEEFMWELAAICDECHKRIHDDGEE